MSRVHLFATLDTLHYLAKSGRVPQAAVLVNSLLNIKPVFTLNQRDAHTVALPRTTESAIKQMLKLMSKEVVEGQPGHQVFYNIAGERRFNLMLPDIPVRIEPVQMGKIA